MFAPAPVALMPERLITPMSCRHGIGCDGLSGMNAAAPSSGAWPVGNQAFYMPIYLDRPGVITKFFTHNGATASGNVDIGLYANFAVGNFARLVSKGSTAQVGTNILQEYDITDLPVSRGVYFLGLAESGTTGTFFRTGLNQGVWGQAMGITLQATAFPLPSTATPALNAQTFPVPIAGIAFRALVA